MERLQVGVSVRRTGHSRRRPMPVLPRRTFLSAATAAAGGFALACVDRTVGVPLLSRATSSLPLDPSSCGIEHVVVMMMENRSFDHFLGWLPDADGRQAGLTYLDSAGVGHPTYALAPDFQGCGHKDPDHSYEGGRVEYNDGTCDGWLRVNDTFSIGYYRQEDLAFLGRAVPQWTSFDRYFCAILGPTFPNRIYQHAGQTDRLSNTPALSTLPTIWDRLAARGLQGRYYYGDVRAGEAFLNQIYAAVTASPAWERTVLFINFDEWGGFFDHVPPPAAPIPDATRVAGDADGLRGFRTPALLISPFAQRGHTSHALYDHTSVLRMIEWRWNLEPLTVRDWTANNLALELDFTRPRLDAAAYPVPPVTGAVCPANPGLIASAVAPRWGALHDVARKSGWGV